VWLYNNTGRSVFAATSFHMPINLTWQLFPVNGSYYDPAITGLMLVCVASVVVGFGAWEFWPHMERLSSARDDNL